MARAGTESGHQAGELRRFSPSPRDAPCGVCVFQQCVLSLPRAESAATLTAFLTALRSNRAVNDPSKRAARPDQTVIFSTTDAARSHHLALDDAVHYLVIAEGSERGRRIEIGEEPIVFGRMAPADVVLPDSEVSRNHCQVNLHLGEVLVVDLNSTNGTFVNGARVAGAVTVPIGGVIVLGRHVLRHERLGRAEAQAVRELDRDLAQARDYVEALLPAPIESGAIRASWVLQPCALLGGDAFGYQALDERYFAVYLMDVSGHGAGAAMLAVSVINVLRRQALPGIDMREPAAVVRELNRMFPMEDHGNMFFTFWYGVIDRHTRRIAFASAGHHPSYLVGADRVERVPLHVAGIVVGALADSPYSTGTAQVPPGATLYVFSDGVYEVLARDGRRWELDDFVPLLAEARSADLAEPERLLVRMQGVTGRPTFEDDFTLVAIEID